MNLLSSVDADTAYLAAKKAGLGMLQPYRYAETDLGHVATIIGAMDPPVGARVLDIGCGTGDVARLAKTIRPDLRFDLLNFSEEQLLDCPPDMPRWLCDSGNMPFNSGTFDVVLFSFALGNMDVEVAVAEAMRVLKVGGTMFINEQMTDNAAASDAMAAMLRYRPMSKDHIEATMVKFGAGSVSFASPRVVTNYLRDNWPGDPSQYDAAFFGTFPQFATAVKQTEVGAVEFAHLFARHEKVGLCLSGGKDSMVCFDMLRPWLGRLRVYWTNPGNPLPETVEFMRNLSADIPLFTEIAGRQREIIAQDGWPSDVVPHLHTTDGNTVFGKTEFKVQSRISCCYRSLMQPMLEGMLNDGVTCIIRGKRREEKDRTGLESGFVSDDGIELCFPLMEWSKADVFAYIKEHNVAIPGYYKHAEHSLDCMDCSAWWGEGLSVYLKNEHPVAFVEYKRRVELIKQAVFEQMAECEV